MTLPISLTTIFSRRYALLPPIKEVRGQSGVWGQVGQSRTVVTTDGATMREVLTQVDSPHSLGYRLSEISGPLGPLVDSIDGRWEFAVQGTGTLVTAMDPARKRSWCTSHALDHTDVARVRTAGTGTSVRAPPRGCFCLDHIGLALGRPVSIRGHVGPSPSRRLLSSGQAEAPF